MGLNRDLLFREARDGHADAVGVLAGALDIVGRIGLPAVGLRQRIEQVKSRSKPTVER